MRRSLLPEYVERYVADEITAQSALQRRLRAETAKLSNAGMQMRRGPGSFIGVARSHHRCAACNRGWHVHRLQRTRSRSGIANGWNADSLRRERRVDPYCPPLLAGGGVSAQIDLRLGQPWIRSPH